MKKVKFYVRNWMEYVDIEQLKKQIDGRDVYLWDNMQREHLEPFLKERGIFIKGTVDNREELLDGSIYFIIALWGRNSETMKKLYDHKLQEDRDFTNISMYKVVSHVDGYYKDSCGNEIITEGSVENVEIHLLGYHNRLYIGEGFGCRDSLKIRMRGNAAVHLGRDIRCRSGEMFFQDSVSVFEGHSYLGGNFFISNFGGEMQIGEGMEVTDGFYIGVMEKTKLTIGRECLVAKDVKILSGGGHSLYDLEEKRNIHMQDNIHVTIGNHVWLGLGSQIIYNTEIGEHSMVGAGSVAKGNYPAYCVIAGNIARVVRENADWCEEDYVPYEEFMEDWK